MPGGPNHCRERFPSWQHDHWVTSYLFDRQQLAELVWHQQIPLTDLHQRYVDEGLGMGHSEPQAQLWAQQQFVILFARPSLNRPVVSPAMVHLFAEGKNSYDAWLACHSRMETARASLTTYGVLCTIQSEATVASVAEMMNVPRKDSDLLFGSFGVPFVELEGMPYGVWLAEDERDHLVIAKVPRELARFIVVPDRPTAQRYLLDGGLPGSMILYKGTMEQSARILFGSDMRTAFQTSSAFMGTMFDLIKRDANDTPPGISHAHRFAIEAERIMDADLENPADRTMASNVLRLINAGLLATGPASFAAELGLG